jgi:arylsulfatase A-like enzyme
MAWGKRIVVTLGIVAVLGAVAYAKRQTLLLHSLGVITDLRHPRAPNQPVPWQEGPATVAAVDATSSETRPPNIIVILADDLGINDVTTYGEGWSGAGVPTPNIDSIARDGVRFDNGYAGNAVCSPSRAQLLTGRYATRFGFEFTPTPGPMARVVAAISNDKTRLRPVITHVERASEVADFNELGMPPSEQTTAELLKARGYHTIHLGKWHLGSTPSTRPANQGFDESLFMESGLYLPEDDPRSVNSKQSFDPIDQFLWPNMRFAVSYNAGQWFEPRTYLTDYLTEEASAAIRANRNRPFFMYLAHWAVHTPLQSLKDDYDALPQISDHRQRVYAAMVRSLDRSVGKVLETLREEGLDDNTLVVFTSDNGAPNYLGIPQVNEPYRGWKLTLFEGGIRVPYVAKWPGVIPAGSRYSERVSNIDLMPTLLAAAGGTPPRDLKVDGVDLLPYLRGATTQPPRPLFWRDGSYQAVIVEDWKLQVSERPRRDRLFNLAEDPTEQHDLAAANPDRVAALKLLLAEHNAQMVAPAWPSLIEAPIMIDKTLDQPEAEDDEYVYWQN